VAHAHGHARNVEDREMAGGTADHWKDEVPGTRWFRADLHIHTLDDPPRDPPPGLTGSRSDPAFLEAYARRVLDAAIDQGIEVLGLTPHSAYVQVGLSAALAVRDLWLTGARLVDGKPYRELIFAVYPGFEPNFQDGMKGLHLLFLLEPTVERDRYFNAFSAVMGGRPPYDGTALERTTLHPRDAFTLLDDPKTLGRDGYVVIAAHPTQQNGVFHRPADDIGDLVGDRVLALEISRNRTLDEEREKESKFRHAYGKGRAALHNSDANHLPALAAAPKDRELGHRFTLVKLATPSLVALRQALLARDARTRLPFVRAADGELVVASDLPEACPVRRPWLRAVTIEGGTSFHRDQTFRFSPDLTCVIGGSMTGKSTLLDGLRLELSGEQGLPDARSSLGQAIRARAVQQFRSGNPTIVLESPAGDASRPVKERFKVRFFGQGELKSLSEDDDGIEHLLFHLVPGRAEALIRQRDELREHDAELWAAAARLVKLQEQVGEAEQAFKRAEDARAAMARFAEAGTAGLPPAQQDVGRASAFASDVGALRTRAHDLAAQIEGLSVPPANGQGVRDALGASEGPTAADLLAQARAAAVLAADALAALHRRAEGASSVAQAALAQLTAEVQAALVAAGGSATDLNAFEAFARAAQHFDSFKAALDQKAGERERALEAFTQRVAKRDQLVADHRSAVQDVCAAVGESFEGRVKVQLQVEGRRKALEDWLLGFKTPGVTLWWRNAGAEEGTATKVRAVAAAVWVEKTADAQRLCAQLGMSDAVARSFLEQLAPWSRQLEAWALRTPDRYQIQWVEGGSAKNLDDLSGGRKVAVLLSLLLQADDPTPLVIDQPEDELDNRFLNDTIIPALHRLKGKRQVIFATHNANIVVNGDADQVIALEADAQHGRVYAAGAIEDDAVREAILRTLDGGEKAFELRRAKYGL
jgi:hypothetical protein